MCGAGQVCDATGTCGSGCWIGGAYYAAGSTNPSGDCQQCNPSVSTSSWSFKPATTQCRAAGGVCDVAEYCTGNSASCPADAVVNAGTSCRAAAGNCDVAEVCDGAGKTCPSDAHAANGTSCGSTGYGGWGSCGGGANYCATSGTQSRSMTTYTCNSGTCNASTSSQSQTCSLTPTTCAAPTYGSWSGCSYYDVCSNEGERSRTVTRYSLNCATGQCAASTTTEYDGCTRTMPTGSCGSPSYGGWGTCNVSNYCSTSGTQYRSMTTYTCGGGTCNASAGSQSQSCSVYPDTSCPGASYGAWSACSFGDACTTTGTQSRSVTSYDFNCSSGQCNASTSTQTQTCTRAPPTVECSGPSYGAWSACTSTDACGQGGVQSRTVTTYSASGCQCVASTTTETQACPTNSTYPWMACGNMCVNVSDNFNHCGGCGQKCPNYKFVCVEGICEFQ
ncbi:hypothetical protein [Cystobacter fuscus]|uniref:hypothetical protein n=1 Tax=Cystobacter fuscus TaxID=43 RepID=UPI001E340BED|nr:hypothetical protein [Cystobacter fuscus]